MALVVKADAAAADAFATKTSLGTAGASFAIQASYGIAAAALAALVAGGHGSTGDVFDIGPNQDGIFGNRTAGVWYLEGELGTTPNTAAPLTADTWQTLRYEATFVSGTTWSIVAKVNGSTFDTYTANLGFASGGTLGPLAIGSQFTSHTAGNVQYVDNVTVESPIGSVVFSDDFESGTFAAWDSTSGSVTIAADPGFTGGGGGGTAPTNDSCANATTLTGLSGTVTADNTLWAGTWPTGADPLWNSRAGSQKGGGAPLWWKWTNTLGRTIDFSATFRATTGDIDVNGGLAVGACGALDMKTADFVANHDYNDLNSDYDLGDAEVIDLIVAPGETVFLEFDSFDDTVTTEPPVATVRGHFTFDWAVRNVTFYDGFDGTTELVSDVTAGRVYADMGAGTTALSFAPTGPVDSLTVAGRFYSLYVLEYDTGSHDVREVWVTSCLLDGSDLHSEMIFSIDPIALSSGIGNPQVVEYPASQPAAKPRLVTDGSVVAAVLPYWEVDANPDRSCPDVPPGATGDYNSDDDAIFLHLQFYDVTTPGSSSLLCSIDLDPSANLNPQWRYRVCASSEQPGVAWVATGWYRRKITRVQGDVLNPFPPHNVIGHTCTTSDDTFEDRFARYSVDLGSGAVTAVSDVSGGLSAWNGGSYGTYSLVSPQIFDIVNDDGYPILAWHKRLSSDSSTGNVTVDSVVTVERLDTGASIQTFWYEDVVGPHAPFEAADRTGGTLDQDSGGGSFGLADMMNTGLRIFPRFAADAGGFDRLVSSEWDNPSSWDSGQSYYWLNVVQSDFTAGLRTADPSSPRTTSGNAYPSRSGFNAILATPWWDGVRNIWVPIFNTGAMNQLDKLCSHGWRSAASLATHIGDSHTPFASGGITLWQYGCWDPSGYFYYVDGNDFGFKRQGPVLRDYWICSVGGVIAPAILGRHRF